MRGKSTTGALARDILERRVPEEVLAVLLKDRDVRTRLDVYAKAEEEIQFE